MGSAVGVKKEDQDHSQTVNISSVIIILRRGLFGGAEQLSPHFRAKSLLFDLTLQIGVFLDGGLPMLDPFGQSEVNQLAMPILIEHYVVQLDIAVDESLPVEIV